jgi:hypothetical protein
MKDTEAFLARHLSRRLGDRLAFPGRACAQSCDGGVPIDASLRTSAAGVPAPGTAGHDRATPLTDTSVALKAMG